MAEEPKSRVKPRIRKTAPTIRERAEAEQAKAEKKAEKDSKPSRRGRVASKAAAPFKKVKLPKPKVKTPKFLQPVTRVIRKVLGWLVPRYFINAWRELRRVTWPSRRETWRLTGAVFIFALVFGTVVYFVDKGLDEIFKKVILK